MVRSFVELKAGEWRVKGMLRRNGAHAGAIEFRFQETQDGKWLGGGHTIPESVEKEVSAAKDKIRNTLKTRYRAFQLFGNSASQEPNTSSASWPLRCRQSSKAAPAASTAAKQRAKAAPKKATAVIKKPSKK
uniref:Uncharacterized protein n=1 Tax=Noctiluca scintillans TaxID=2966 RepID=A0A7S1F8Q4_NOCSC|mmetsp:Transcript_43611/g.115187  ORF Transcript_43611/g.115187 Transcript_43611/m.115187 type:complete len:132 (+) Transcript_43611:81-476(+)